MLNEEKQKSEIWYKPVMMFYAKTTSWIIIPLVLGLIVGQFTKSQILFFVFLMIGFGITCFGIYREIKQYKKSLDSSSPKATDEQRKNGNK